MRLTRPCLLLLIVCAVGTGCGDDDTAPSPPLVPTASGGTTSATSPSTFPALEKDGGARATGGVFEAPGTQPRSR
jgi:hypothetical protein